MYGHNYSMLCECNFYWVFVTYLNHNNKTQICSVMLTTLDKVFSGALLALLHNLQLLSNLSKSADHLFVPVRKGKNHVRDAYIIAKCLDQLLGLAQVVPRETWEQMVNNLKVETAMYKIKPSGTIDVHRCPHHFLRK